MRKENDSEGRKAIQAMSFICDGDAEKLGEPSQQ